MEDWEDAHGKGIRPDASYKILQDKQNERSNLEIPRVCNQCSLSLSIYIYIRLSLL